MNITHPVPEESGNGQMVPFHAEYPLLYCSGNHAGSSAVYCFSISSIQEILQILNCFCEVGEISGAVIDVEPELPARIAFLILLKTMCLISMTGLYFCDRIIPVLQQQSAYREDIKNPGVYFLFCKEDDGSDSVYIGEAENVKERLVQHLRDSQAEKEKYYWTTAVIFTGRDLNKAHICSG